MSDLDKLQNEGDSKYNSSIDILMRINRLIEYAEQGSFNENLDGLRQWRQALAALTREVKPYCNKEQRATLEKAVVSQVPNPAVARRFHVQVNEQEIRKKLEHWEDVIRELLAKKGMALKAGKDPGKSILE